MCPSGIQLVVTEYEDKGRTMDDGGNVFLKKGVLSFSFFFGLETASFYIQFVSTYYPHRQKCQFSHDPNSLIQRTDAALVCDAIKRQILDVLR